MENDYQPFFSRKQLNVLMWFSLIAILVLSSLGPGDVEYHDVEHNKDKTIYWMELDDQLNTLTLLLPSQPALNKTQKQLQQLNAQVLLKRLQAENSQIYTYNVYPRQDRIEVSLHWAGDTAGPDLTSLLNQLKQPVEPSRWEHVLKTLEARDYLDSKGDTEKVIQHFFAGLQSDSSDVIAQLPSAYSSLFHDIKYVVSGDNAQKIAEQLSDSLPDHHNDYTNTVASPIATNLQLNAEDSTNSIYLTGGTIPSRADPNFVSHRLAAQVLQDLLAQYRDQFKYDYRLLWASLKQSGYQAVILTSVQNPEAIAPQLRQLIDEELVEAAQKQLASEWQEKMRELSNQVQALNLIAFYDLPTDTLEEYVSQIEDQDIETVIQLAKSALDGKQQINIRLSPGR